VQWFSSVDSDRSGQIDVKELQRALAMGGLNFSLAVVAHMIRYH
jgi:Ca2+-binding EF-hand superfamily protein